MAGRRTYDTPAPAQVPAGEVHITDEDGVALVGMGRVRGANKKAYTKFFQVQSVDEGRALWLALADHFGFKTVAGERKAAVS